MDLSNILWLATSFGNCSTEMVDFLVKLKADVNEQWNLPLTNPLGLLVRVTSLRHRFGTPTHFTRLGADVLSIYSFLCGGKVGEHFYIFPHAFSISMISYP